MVPWPPKVFFLPGSPSITMLRRLEKSQLSQKLGLWASLAGVRLRAGNQLGGCDMATRLGSRAAATTP